MKPRRITDIPREAREPLSELIWEGVLAVGVAVALMVGFIWFVSIMGPL